MSRKQILNYVFEDLSDGSVKVTLPNGVENILHREVAAKAYNKLYAAKNTDKLCEQVLKELGYTKENIHLTSYSVERQFRDKLEKLLRQNNIDLSYDSAVTKKWGIKISGNSNGIVSSYISYLWSGQWKEVNMTPLEIEEYLEKNKDVKVFTYTRLGIEKVSNGLNYILKTKFGSESYFVGIDSQSSIHKTTVKIKRDRQGNLLIDKRTLVYEGETK